MSTDSTKLCIEIPELEGICSEYIDLIAGSEYPSTMLLALCISSSIGSSESFLDLVLGSDFERILLLLELDSLPDKSLCSLLDDGFPLLLTGLCYMGCNSFSSSIHSEIVPETQS